MPVLSAVTQQPGLTIYDYAQMLEMCPHSVRKRMWALQSAGRVQSDDSVPAAKGALRWHPAGALVGRRKAVSEMPVMPVDRHPLAKAWPIAREVRA